MQYKNRRKRKNWYPFTKSGGVKLVLWSFVWNMVCKQEKSEKSYNQGNNAYLASSAIDFG